MSCLGSDAPGRSEALLYCALVHLAGAADGVGVKRLEEELVEHIRVMKVSGGGLKGGGQGRGGARAGSRSEGGGQGGVRGIGQLQAVECGALPVCWEGRGSVWRTYPNPKSYQP